MPKEDEFDEIVAQPSSKLPLIIIGAVLIIGIAAIITVIFMKQEKSQLQKQKPSAEYVVQSRLYQLKDGSYLKMSFSIVVDEDKLIDTKSIIEKEGPGRLPHGINMLLGNKSRADLISGTHKREALAREVKKVLEEQVFRDHNQRQSSPEDSIEVREILIHDFVTQTG